MKDLVYHRSPLSAANRYEAKTAVIDGDRRVTKVPKSVEFRTDPLPLSGALKVLKRELRAPYWEGRDRSV